MIFRSNKNVYLAIIISCYSPINLNCNCNKQTKKKKRRTFTQSHIMPKMNSFYGNKTMTKKKNKVRQQIAKKKQSKSHWKRMMQKTRWITNSYKSMDLWHTRAHEHTFFIFVVEHQAKCHVLKISVCVCVCCIYMSTTTTTTKNHKWSAVVYAQTRFPHTHTKVKKNFSFSPTIGSYLIH